MRWPRAVEAWLVETGLREPQAGQRDAIISTDDWIAMFQGLQYQIGGIGGTISNKQEDVASNFEGYVRGAYAANGIVFACVVTRAILFSEARFQFRQLRSGQPGDLFGGKALAPLENPESGRTTGDMLFEALVDVDMAGNWYGCRVRNEIRRLRPDWVTIVMGSRQDKDVTGWDLNGELLGYIYQPGGPGSGREPVALLPEQVAHFAPIKDPLARYRGMSWLTPILAEVQSDQAMTSHKLRYFEQGATPNIILSLDPEVSPEAFVKWEAMFEAKYGNAAASAYKTWILGGGAKPQVVGANLQQVSFRENQGAAELRIAAAAGVPPPILGLTAEQATPYSAYPFARRRMGDATLRPLWRNIAGSLERIVSVPPSSQLWYDDSDIPFLREDEKDRADILEVHSRSLKGLIEAGWEPNSARDAITAGDLRRLKHSGVPSVQLQKAGGQAPAPAQIPPGPQPKQIPAKAGRALLVDLLSAAPGPESS